VEARVPYSQEGVTLVHTLSGLSDKDCSGWAKKWRNVAPLPPSNVAIAPMRIHFQFSSLANRLPKKYVPIVSSTSL
jgi:hypothetical protein